MVDYIKYLFLPRLGLYPLMLELYNAPKILTFSMHDVKVRPLRHCSGKRLFYAGEGRGKTRAKAPC